MNYSIIKKNDIANGIGVRVSLFVSGCTHHCKGCFNEQTWSFNYGTPFTTKTIDEIITALAPDYIQGLSILGGEPLELANQQGLLPLVKLVKKLYPSKDIWCYTGYTFEEIITWQNEEIKELLGCIDILVDGEFIQNQKNLMLNFRGSSNQRIIMVQPSLQTNKVILHPLNN